MLHILKAMRDDQKFLYEPIVFSKEDDFDDVISQFYNQTKPEEYVSQKVACAVLQKTRKVLQNLRVRKNGLKSRLCSGRVFFKKQDLLDFLKQEQQ